MKSTSRWAWVIANVVRQLWFRASLFSLAAVATALLAWFVKPWIPADWPALVGADAVDGILGILGASMLSVTVFSLTTMVSAYSAASTNVTPRATRLLLEDSTSQNALSTFLGAFLFALVGIVALSTGLYGDSGRLVLFVATLLVLLVIVVTLLRWITHLSTLGQTGDTIERVEAAAKRALEGYLAQPLFGGAAKPGPLPSGGHLLLGEQVGYLLHIDVEALARAAGDDGTIHVCSLPGSFIHRSQALAWVSFDDPDRQHEVARAFSIGAQRGYDQDPRFGIIVLAEIASRSLSAAVNDSGTAISVIGALVRILDRWSQREELPEPLYERVFVPELDVDDLFDDAFAPIARDGAGIVEVGLRLQKSLAMLAAVGDAPTRRAARRLSSLALEYAEASLKLESERARLRAAAARV
ncbi:MAG TPA: DUF2254 domain-containing protein [Burkholderiaceae bacterium]|nr:DUF2254 domain-containing protein [Burkholderiaceae bacterium]